MAPPQSSSSAILASCVGILLLLKEIVATEFVVGNQMGWTNYDAKDFQVPDYGAWATSQRVTVGDYVVFKYAKWRHNVNLLPNQAAYLSCDFSQATLLDAGESGTYIWRARRAGVYYFGCNKAVEEEGNHCGSGQKLALVVSARRSIMEVGGEGAAMLAAATPSMAPRASSPTAATPGLLPPMAATPIFPPSTATPMAATAPKTATPLASPTISPSTSPAAPPMATPSAVVPTPSSPTSPPSVATAPSARPPVATPPTSSSPPPAIVAPPTPTASATPPVVTSAPSSPSVPSSSPVSPISAPPAPSFGPSSTSPSGSGAPAPSTPSRASKSVGRLSHAAFGSFAVATALMVLVFH